MINYLPPHFLIHPHFFLAVVEKVLAGSLHLKTWCVMPRPRRLKPVTMTWKSTIIYLVLFWMGGMAFAQEAERKEPQRRFLAELSSVFLDYQGLTTGNLTAVNQFSPGITMGAHAYLGRRFNLSSGMTFVPELQYPLEEYRQVTTSLIDVNTMLRLKLNKPDALFAPFLGLGAGINSGSNQLRFYVPVSLGLNLQLQENFAIVVQSTYKQGFGEKNIQHLAHTVGFVFGIPGTEIRESNDGRGTKGKSSQGNSIAQIDDRDGDGVPDRDDMCADQPGRAMHLGCPIDNIPVAPVLPVDNEPKKKELVIIADSGKDDPDPLESGTVVTPKVQEKKKDEPVRFERVSNDDIEIVQQAMDRIYFEAGSKELTEESKLVLNEVAEVLGRNPLYHLDVRGYTANIGEDDPKKVLSVMRAFSVKRYLCYNQKIDYMRVYADGETAQGSPLGGYSDTDVAENRRVEFSLIAPDQSGYRGNTAE